MPHSKYVRLGTPSSVSEQQQHRLILQKQKKYMDEQKGLARGFIKALVENTSKIKKMDLKSVKQAKSEYKKIARRLTIRRQVLKRKKAALHRKIIRLVRSRKIKF